MIRVHAGIVKRVLLHLPVIERQLQLGVFPDSRVPDQVGTLTL